MKRGGEVIVLDASTADQDGFWMSASRFLSQFDIHIVGGELEREAGAYRHLDDSVGRFPNVTELCI